MPNISLDLLKQIALNVYENVNPLLGTEKAAEKNKRGAGGDLSMHIDILAEKVIIDLLERSNLDLLLISEEIGEKLIGNKKKATENQYRLIVDPVDGSNNAVRGVPFCSVSIAFAIGNNLNDIIKAVIIDLTTKDLFWAEKGKGAYFNNKRIYVSNKDISQNCLIELNLPLRKVIQELKKYNIITKRFYRIRIMGSTALTLCQIAKGSIDAFIDLVDNSRLVDMAAGFLILKEAGGKIFSKEGKELDKKLSINTKFPFIASNAKLEPFLKEKLIKINSIPRKNKKIY